jgi:hypothetical protein
MDLSLSISVYDLLSICIFHITSADISEYNYHFRELNYAKKKLHYRPETIAKLSSPR